MKEGTLKELYIDELRDIYNAENQLTKALPKMAKAANSEELRAGFEEHLEIPESRFLAIRADAFTTTEPA